MSTAMLLAGSAVIATGAAQASTTITEAGSSLVYPLVQDWGTNFSILSGNSVSSASVGSGTGIADVCGNSVEIGASDAPLGYPGVASCGDNTPATLANYVEIPWALSATGFVYNIPVSGGSITNGLHLTAADLAGIYSGTITNWDQLQSQQYKYVTKTETKKVHGKKKKVHVKVKVELFKSKLPDLAISPVFRSDGSGDSFAVTTYLSKANSAWATKYGASTQFPTTGVGTGSHGNSGVATTVEATAGAIGYVSNFYAITVVNSGDGIGIAQVQNAAGNFEFPNVAQIDDAASSISTPPAQNTSSTSTSDYFGMVIQDPSKKYSTAYPVSTYTYAIVARDSGASATAVQGFLTYAVSAKYNGESGGVDVGDGIGFAPLTPAIQKYDQGLIKNDITTTPAG